MEADPGKAADRFDMVRGWLESLLLDNGFADVEGIISDVVD
jgi:hypothetical protein